MRGEPRRPIGAKVLRAFRELYGVKKWNKEGMYEQPSSEGFTLAELLERLALAKRDKRPTHLRRYVARLIELGTMRVELGPDGLSRYYALSSLFGLPRPYDPAPPPDTTRCPRCGRTGNRVRVYLDRETGKPLTYPLPRYYSLLPYEYPKRECRSCQIEWEDVRVRDRARPK